MNVISVISLCVSGIMLVMSVITSILNQSRATKKDTSEMEMKFSNLEKILVELRVGLEDVKRTATETKQDIKGVTTNLTDLNIRLTRAEEQLVTAFNQIDELRNRQNNMIQGG